MTSQAAQDLEDDEHATNLQKTHAHGRQWTREHQFVKERLESYLDMHREPRRCARRKRDPRTSTRLLHDHDHDHLHDATTRVGALVTHHPG